MSGFVGSAFAQVQLTPQEFSQEEIDEMKNKAVQISMNGGTFMIEFFPEDAPNTVHNFLKLVKVVIMMVWFFIELYPDL